MRLKFAKDFSAKATGRKGTMMVRAIVKLCRLNSMTAAVESRKSKRKRLRTKLSISEERLGPRTTAEPTLLFSRIVLLVVEILPDSARTTWRLNRHAAKRTTGLRLLIVPLNGRKIRPSRRTTRHKTSA
jgi:hypothetical protein